jgi:dTDP-glucose pyrophosphorylase
MKDWRKTIIGPGKTIREAMQIIDSGALQIALLVDGNHRLIGVITDGDIRSALLRGFSLDQPADLIACRDFTYVTAQTGLEEIMRLMKARDLRHIPILNEAGRIIGLKTIVDVLPAPSLENWVVLMAGGLGERLKPLTDHCPKPLIRVGEAPILETIIKRFSSIGFKRFFISVNYKAEMIEEFLDDGSQWGLEITYLRETKKMGTAGSLGLLPKPPDRDLIVMNADLLTTVNFGHLLDFHRNHHAVATMCVRDYHFQVPYGVVETEHHRLKAITEKPLHQFFVNAGIYVLAPEALRFIPRDEPFDMTDLFEKLIAERLDVAVFPIREYWIDIGRSADLMAASDDFNNYFSKE